MKYSYNWLKELTGTKKNADELAQMVMLKGFELEGKEKLAGRFDKIVVGEILEIKKHPDADKLQLVKVNIGDKQLEIVCGAHNIQKGDKVPVALVGAIIPKNKLKIEKTKIRGVASSGMLCAEDELGLGKDHSGILILDSELKIGMSLAEVLGLNDEVLEFSVLPNRAHDCLSYQGMAREILTMIGQDSQITNSKLEILNKTEITNFKSENSSLQIEIKDKDLCPRYMGAVMTGVKIGPSPQWMQSRLIASGMEPINNVVDITNYVMLEVGNPLHCFDFDKIKTETMNPKSETLNKSEIPNSESQKIKIVVRKAKKGEELELLDETKLKLDENDLVIANEERALALAGIKGGKDSGISADTSTIVLESANFNAFSIRKSRQRHAMLTEAQSRFEKSISPVLAEKALARAIELFKEHAEAKLQEVVDENFHEQKENSVELELKKIEKLLGEKVDEKQVLTVLKNLGFEIESEKEGMITLKIPYWRLDIEGPEDLIEEVGRIIGYENIEESAIKAAIEAPVENKSRKFEWKLKELMTGLGFDEMINYSFYSDEEAADFGIEGKHFELENPLTVEHAQMRKTLLPHLVSNVGINQKHCSSFLIFELGRTYLVESEEGPVEKLKLAGVIFDKNYKGDIFYLVKGRLEGLFEALGLAESEINFSSSNKTKYLQSGKGGEIEINGKALGVIGELSDELRENYEIDGTIGVFEIDFETLFGEYKESLGKRQYRSVSKFPRVLRDISMFIDHKIEAKAIAEVIRKTGGEELLEVELFDVYWDKKSVEKSLAFHLEFGDERRTLKSEEADEAIEKIIKGLEVEGAKVRTQ